MTKHKIAIAVLLTALALLAPGAGAQDSQTLPPNLEAVTGNSNTSLPMSTFNDQIWQWHYDSSMFDVQAPITITEISVRASSATDTAMAWSFSLFEVTLIEASSDQAAANSTFAGNVLRSQVCRSGSFSGGPVGPSGAATATWIPLELYQPFMYSASTGNDLIIQIRKCGTAANAGVAFDYHSGVLASRQGNLTDCNAAASNFSNSSGAPVVKIDYLPAAQTLPSGFETTAGNSATGFPFNTSTDHVWQWHYDSSEFLAQQAININRISVRMDSSGGTAAFNYTNMEIALIEASTDYVAASHDVFFPNNYLRRKVVRTGPYTGGPFSGVAGFPTQPWISLGIEESFTYDPSTGNDLIIEIRTCGPISSFGATIDGVLGSPGTVGGNRYGHTSNCNSQIENTRNNEFVPIVLVNYTPAEGCGIAVDSFPYFEDFGAAATEGTTQPPEGWAQDSRDTFNGVERDWRFRSTSTASTGTGPSSDHTTMTVGDGDYAYVEDSGGESEEINLLSPCFDLSGVAQPMLSFRAHSNNANGFAGPFANLFVDVIGKESGLHPSLTILGHRGDSWDKVQVDLTPYKNEIVRLRFRVNNDNDDFVHDIAIDDVYVGEGGTRDDLELTTGINGIERRDESQKSAGAGDFFSWTLDSPAGTLWGQVPILIAQFFADGPVPAANALPELYMDVSNAIIVLYDGNANPTPLGLPVLAPGGFTQGGLVPPGFNGFNVVIQGLISNPVVNNGIYGLSVPHYLDF